MLFGVFGFTGIKNSCKKFIDKTGRRREVKGKEN
jgi:hypothetical protein